MLRSRLARCEHALEEEFGSLSWAERGFFFMLPMACDRLGYTLDKPAQIRAALAPYDPPESVAEIRAMIEGLIRARYVERFEADGEVWLWMRVFPKDQKPHVNETASTAPRAPSDLRHRASPGDQQHLPLADQRQTKGKPRLPVTDGGNPVSDPVTGEGGGSGAAAPADLPPPPPAPQVEPEQGTPAPAPAPTTEDFADELARAARTHLVAPGALTSVPDNREFKLWCEFVERVAPELRPALVARATELMRLAAAHPRYGRGAAEEGKTKFTVTNPHAFVRHYGELNDKLPTELRSAAQEALLSEAARERKAKADQKAYFEARREELERQKLAAGVRLTPEVMREVAAQASEETRAHFARAGPAPGPDSHPIPCSNP